MLLRPLTREFSWTSSPIIIIASSLALTFSKEWPPEHLSALVHVDFEQIIGIYRFSLQFSYAFLSCLPQDLGDFERT